MAPWATPRIAPRPALPAVQRLHPLPDAATARAAAPRPPLPRPWHAPPACGAMQAAGSQPVGPRTCISHRARKRPLAVRTEPMSPKSARTRELDMRPNSLADPFFSHLMMSVGEQPRTKAMIASIQPPGRPHPTCPKLCRWCEPTAEPGIACLVDRTMLHIILSMLRGRPGRGSFINGSVGSGREQAAAGGPCLLERGRGGVSACVCDSGQPVVCGRYTGSKAQLKRISQSLPPLRRHRRQARRSHR